MRPPTEPLATLSARTHVCDGGRSLLGVAGGVGGESGLVRLDDAEAAAVAAGPVGGELARRLLDADLADPLVTPRPVDAREVSVVVPVRDDAVRLGRLLAALREDLPPGVEVVVVDDASRAPGEVAAVVLAHGARLVAHRRNRGPAAARDSGLREVTTPCVAFVDVDVVPEPGWLERLLPHLDDPSLAVVAPRVLGPAARPGDGAVARYEQARSSLDLGPAPAAVRAGGRVSYLPGACLLARTAALGDGFDPRLRCGEDVDLVRRLLAAGWRVRYEPGAHVRHEHRTGVAAWAGRKAFYGTSAAPLAARHPQAAASLVMRPWTVALLGGLVGAPLLGRRALAVTGAAAGLALVGRTRGLRRDGSPRPVRAAAVVVLEEAVAALWGSGSVLLREQWPTALLAAVVSRRARRTVVVVGVLDAVADHRRTGPRLGLLPYAALRRLDDVAYGAGVWAGALREGSVRALVPVRVSRPRRPTGRGGAAPRW
ncbi:mycofactocin biosynthesis glycosyltransferase MftF [Nocardioides kribbensis]|uniref:mycofactocin biosynthesis glycosyltransferase MftF n=1 Tax=Nocardioides kribbensis TaxID=305517 RepID=UPI00187A9AC7|nr:mycofactocin biosynthesis glycosyltransferase MftF [Nocardioides kribbensis]